MSSEDNLLPLIIEPEELAAHLDASELLIIDVPLKAESHAQGHVPGAVYLDHRRLLAGSGEVPNEVPSAEALSQLFSSLGLTRDTHVVAYDDEGGGWAGRLLWTLELLGHGRYSYLNGGIQAWRAAELPIATDTVTPNPSEYTAEFRHPEAAIDRHEIIERLEDADLAIWDARSRDEYLGHKGDNQRLGHIPGAVNFEWTRAMDPERQLRIRDYAELVTELDALGLTTDMDIVTHCQTHHRSGFTWLVGKALGLRMRGYAGSWKEWGNRDDTPIETS
ncbi:rhodanese-like domain-containing protein [Halomonas sabkhae]|uniref:sulfurtransferase n=1 Tax=Halomonas sabkhae TaxID=626223 RepID=UPI0025B4E8C5|nr:rhodanese-like domain-containing protein [Halomonas sabkhae]MDN3526213.1 rhodanese-like domain-containing protein [Halomonas sabkhae]